MFGIANKPRQAEQGPWSSGYGCPGCTAVDGSEYLRFHEKVGGSVSAATLFRVIHESAPTVLIDEAEVLGAQGERAEAVREILNAGYRRGPGVPRCVGDDHHVERFLVFGPKILAAIGRLWDTLEDRSLIVELKRKRRDEQVERFRRRKAEPVAVELRRQLFRWGQDHVEELRDVAPLLPEFLDDRAQDTWEPFLAIAALAGDGRATPRLTDGLADPRQHLLSPTPTCGELTEESTYKAAPSCLHRLMAT